MTQHPDLVDEQAYVDHAYACLDQSRADAWRLREMTETGRGGTHQARYEAEVIEEAITSRLTQLQLHTAALVFGRIDRHVEGGTEAFHIGRLAVADEHRDPVVVDWRAPVAEPFYRATGRQPMGLARRRHFSTKGQHLLAIEDELFGEGHLGVGPDAETSTNGHGRGHGNGNGNGDGHRPAPALQGYSTLLAALEQGRSGQLGDIVATIQAEQDEIIRSPQAGVLVVQGGPGTGKTVVALHRAAYLLYTFRFPLEDQGVLVIGPNRLFLRYIERVLPSLGEAGVEQAVLADLVPDVRFGAVDQATAAKVKGDARMIEVIAKAVRDRQRPLKEALVVPYGLTSLRLTPAQSEQIVQAARRRFRRHNAGRKYVETELFNALAASARDELDPEHVRERVRPTDLVRVALERMWPILTPAQLLHDLYGSRALLKLAGAKWLTEDEYQSLARPRSAELGDVSWTEGDVALLDEARYDLGPRPGKSGKLHEEEEIRTYGHIVIDEVQDLSPMQLRMMSRRSLNGSMTVVGDVAQATGQHAPHDWRDILVHLPDKRAPRVTELTVGYRIPSATMALAAKVLRVAAPRVTPPTSVRDGDGAPEIVQVEHGALAAGVADAVTRLRDRVDDGNVAVVVPSSLHDDVVDALTRAGIAFGRAAAQGLDEEVTVVPVGMVKGLELDAVVVVEPARIVAEEPQGLRSLYVALTRATKYLTVVHAAALPEALSS